MRMVVNIRGQLPMDAPRQYFNGFTHLIHTTTQRGRYRLYLHLKMKNLKGWEAE